MEFTPLRRTHDEGIRAVATLGRVRMNKMDMLQWIVLTIQTGFHRILTILCIPPSRNINGTQLSALAHADSVFVLHLAAMPAS
jgi:hypothetical protein